MSWQLFGVDLEPDSDAIRFMDSAKNKARLGSTGFGLATWHISRIPRVSGGLCYVVGVENNFLNPVFSGLLVFAVPLLFTGLVFSWWLVPGLFLVLLSGVTSDSFRFLILFMGLRKYGYYGPVKWLGHKAIIMRLLKWDSLK